MRGTALLPASLALLLLSNPALACSPIPSAFSDWVPRAELAIRARPSFLYSERRFEISEEREGRLAGHVTFDRIHCYRVAKRVGRCPKRLTVAFDYALDGYNCPPDIAALDPERLRYFLLARDANGAWHIDGAYRRFDR